MTLSIDDIDAMKSGGLIGDRRLAGALGYSGVKSFHLLINRNRKELEYFGAILEHFGKTDAEKRAKQTLAAGETYYACWLNTEQVMIVSFAARTEGSQAVRRQLLEMLTESSAGQYLDRIFGLQGSANLTLITGG